jgi:hypothetical protein
MKRGLLLFFAKVNVLHESTKKQETVRRNKPFSPMKQKFHRGENFVASRRKFCFTVVKIYCYHGENLFSFSETFVAPS